MWIYLNEVLAYAAYYYECILDFIYGNRFVVRSNRLIRCSPSHHEVCVVRDYGWKTYSSRIDRGHCRNVTVNNITRSVILEVCISNNHDERISQFLTPLLGCVDNGVKLQGWEVCALASIACGSDCCGQIDITYLDMTTDTFEENDVILIREECLNLTVPL